MTQHTCICGHDRESHEHYRAGTDCAFCTTGCARYRDSVPAWQRGLAALGVALPKSRQLASR